MRVLLFAALLLTAPGLAASLIVHTVLAAEQPNPCAHGPQTATLGGQDLTLLKCQLAVDDQRIADLDRQLRMTETDRIIARNDLSTAQDREKALAEWFKAYFAEPAK